MSQILTRRKEYNKIVKKLKDIELGKWIETDAKIKKLKERLAELERMGI